jgi:hypothetical protein
VNWFLSVLRFLFLLLAAWFGLAALIFRFLAQTGTADLFRLDVLDEVWPDEDDDHESDD